jgi:toxin ParE1/3/4
MSSGNPGRYRLTPRALADLDDIWRFSAERWSVDHANGYVDELVRIFDLIAAVPTLARERREFTPPVRIHVHRAHLIVYLTEPDQILIVRLLGGRQDWAAILNAADI